MTITVKSIQNSFTSGEIDDSLRSRIDIEQYYKGAAKLRNVYVTPQGGVKRRYGTEYITTLPSSNIKLIPFSFSATENYTLVLSAETVTVYSEGAVVDTIENLTPLTNSIIPEIKYTQSYDTIILFHSSTNPLYITRFSHTNWEGNVWAFRNKPAARQTGDETTGLILTITDSNDNPIDFAKWTIGDIFKGAKATFSSSFGEAQVNDYLIDTHTGRAKITAVTSNLEVTITILSPFINELKSGKTEYQPHEWHLIEEIWGVLHGWPTCGTFFQGRLWCANSKLYPDGIWGSIVNNEHDFNNWLPSFADNGIFVAAGMGKHLRFQHMLAGQHITLYANNGEYSIPRRAGEPITPTNVSVIKDSSFGIYPPVPPVEVESSIYFVRKGGKALIESFYVGDDTSYKTVDLNLLNPEILENPLSIAVQTQVTKDDSDYIFLPQEDGTMPVLCSVRDQQITAWTLTITEGKFLDVSVEGDDVYFIVERNFGGPDIKCFEKLNPLMMFDSGKYDTNTSVLTGLDHLIGQTVGVIANGKLLENQTVTGTGVISVPETVSTLQAGLEWPFLNVDGNDDENKAIVYIETMPLEIQTQQGTSIGTKKRVSEITCMLEDTKHLHLATNNDPLVTIGVEDKGELNDKQSITGDVTTNGILGWADDLRINAFQTLHLPMKLLGMGYKVRA